MAVLPVYCSLTIPQAGAGRTSSPARVAFPRRLLPAFDCSEGLEQYYSRSPKKAPSGRSRCPGSPAPPLPVPPNLDPQRPAHRTDTAHWGFVVRSCWAAPAPQGSTLLATLLACADQRTREEEEEDCEPHQAPPSWGTPLSLHVAMPRALLLDQSTPPIASPKPPGKQAPRQQPCPLAGSPTPATQKQPASQAFARFCTLTLAPP